MPFASAPPEAPEQSHGLYSTHEDLLSSHLRFPMPGRDSAGALRKILGAKLPYHLLISGTDGANLLDEVSNDHLAGMQAILWRDEPRSKALSSFLYETDQILSTKVNLASHVRYIADQMSQQYIFIHSEVLRSCCLSKDCHSNTDPTSRTRFIALEPLFHWGSVTPAYDLNIALEKVLVFRRDGEKMNDPLWTETIRKRIAGLSPARSYCIDCLELLFNNRAEAWAIIDHLTSAVTACEYIKPIQRPMPASDKKTDNNSSVSGPDMPLHMQATADGRSIANKSSKISLDVVSQGNSSWLQLDGASDTPTFPAQQRHSGRFTTSYLQTSKQEAGLNDSGQYHDKNPQQGHIFGTTSQEAPSDGVTFKRPCIELSVDNDTPPTSKKLHASFYNSSSQLAAEHPSSNLIISDHENRELSEYVKLGSKDLHPSEPDFSPTRRNFKSSYPIERTFGRELDVNEITTFIRRRTESRQDMADKISESSKDCFVPTFQCITPSPKKDTKIEEAKKCPSVVSQLSHIGGQPAAQGTLAALIHKAAARKSTSQLRKTFSTKPKPAATKTSTLPKVLPKTNKLQPQFPPVFAKHALMKDVPSGFDPAAYQAHNARAPEYHQRICICQKIARTPEKKIVQCSNKDCSLSWYHFECLEKSQKIQARFNTMICQMCRNERAFESWDKNKNWPVESIAQQEFRMPSGGDILAALPGVGGISGTTLPYGLGGAENKAPEPTPTATPSDPGALGNLPFFGYVRSEPQALVESRVHAGAWGDTETVYTDGSDEGEDTGEDEFSSTLVVDEMEGIQKS